MVSRPSPKLLGPSLEGRLRGEGDIAAQRPGVQSAAAGWMREGKKKLLPKSLGVILVSERIEFASVAKRTRLGGKARMRQNRTERGRKGAACQFVSTARCGSDIGINGRAGRRSAPGSEAQNSGVSVPARGARGLTTREALGFAGAGGGRPADARLAAGCLWQVWDGNALRGARRPTVSGSRGKLGAGASAIVRQNCGGRTLTVPPCLAAFRVFRSSELLQP